MFYNLPFTICKLPGVFKVENKKIYDGLSPIIRPHKNTINKIYITAYSTKEKTLRIQINNEQEASCYIPKNMPAYGVLNILKGTLQILVLSHEIYLFHGYTKGGTMHLFGTKTDLFDKKKGELEIGRRTVHIRRENGRNVIYNDFFSAGKLRKRNLTRIICHKEGEISNEQFIYESFFLYFMIHHFFPKKKEVLPQYTRETLKNVASQLSMYVNNHRTLHQSETID